MSVRSALLALPLMVAVTQEARALAFSFSTLAGDTLSGGQASAFNAAASAWSAVLSDPVTVSVQIGFRSLAVGTLGVTTLSLRGYDTANIETLLRLDAKGARDAAALANLPAATGLSYISTGQGKAIGIPFAGLDGAIEFSTGYSFAEQRSPDGSVPSGQYDLVGVAAHEIGHLLGFESILDTNAASGRTVLDYFRYGAAGVPSLTAGAPAYFSLDGGVTSLAGFSAGGAGYAQASHWLSGTGGLMDPALGTGQANVITALDITALDVIGWDAVPVPEPVSLALLAPALLAATGLRRFTNR